MILSYVFLKINIFEKIINGIKNLHALIYWPIIAALLYIIGYTSYYSGVGKGLVIEERMSLITMSAIILLFLIKKIEFKLFYIFGLLSYEIYLFHWPLLYRYDFIFKFLPGWLGMCVYLILFLALGWLVQQAVKILNKIFKLS